MNQDYSEVEHWYDVWNVAKGKYHTIIVCNIHWFNIGLKKKLQKAEDCSVIGEWAKSITNHMHWCAASSLDGDGDEIMIRWQSLMDHLCNDYSNCYGPGRQT